MARRKREVGLEEDPVLPDGSDQVGQLLRLFSNQKVAYRLVPKYSDGTFPSLRPALMGPT